MTVSIIIPLYNGADCIATCLQAVLSQSRSANTRSGTGVGDGSAEIIVIDNASQDRSPSIVHSFAPAVRIHAFPYNSGFAGAVNQGILLSHGDLIILLNQDAIPQVGWLDALISSAVAHPSCGIFGSKCLRSDGSLDHAGGVISRPLFYTSHLGAGQPEHSQYDEPGLRDYVTGAAIAIRRSTIERVGLLDAGFYPVYYEETDLCLRATAAGIGVWYEPRASVLHTSDRTPLEQMSASRIATFHRSRLRCLLKHTPVDQLGGVLEHDEIKDLLKPQEAAVLVGRALAYRDVLMVICGNDAVLAPRTPQHAVTALVQCFRTAISQAHRVIRGEADLPLDERIRALPRQSTWDTLTRNFVRVSDALGKIEQSINLHSEAFQSASKELLKIVADLPLGEMDMGTHVTATPATDAALAEVMESVTTESVPPTGVGVNKSQKGERQVDESPSTISWQLDDLESLSLLEKLQDQRRQILVLHRQFVSLSELVKQNTAPLPPLPTIPAAPRGWLDRLWKSLKLLPDLCQVINNIVRHIERMEQQNTSQFILRDQAQRALVSTIAEAMLLLSQTAETLQVLHQQISTRLASIADSRSTSNPCVDQVDSSRAEALHMQTEAPVPVNQNHLKHMETRLHFTEGRASLLESRVAQSEAHINELRAIMTDLAGATNTSTRFLHECLVWDTSILSRLNELHQITAMMVGESMLWAQLPMAGQNPQPRLPETPTSPDPDQR